MKKKNYLALSTLLMLVLSACGGSNGTSNENIESNNSHSISDSISNSLNSNEGQSSEETTNSSSLINSSSQEADKNGWTAAEKAIFTQYLYGADVPYYYVEGCSTLTYDEDSATAIRRGGTSSKSLLTAYANLFDETWYDDSSTSDEDVEYYGYFCAFTKEVTTSAGTRNVYVSFGGVTEDEDGYLEMTDDGTGEFYFSVYDPYYYEWPSNILDEYVAILFETDETVPAFNGADVYQLSTSYAALGMLSLYCYTSDTSAVSKYSSTLKAAGWNSNGKDEDGYTLYESPKATLEVAIAYDSDYEDLDIYIYEGDGEPNTGGNTGGSTTPSEENPLGGTDVLTIDSFGISESAKGYVDGNYNSKKTGAYYVANAYGSNKNIQLKSKDDSAGIVSLLSGGVLELVSVVWNSVTESKANNTTASQAALTVQIYASNSSFTIADMYDGSVSQVGSINYRNGETSYTFTDTYKYVGIRSELGAINLDSLTVVWNA